MKTDPKFYDKESGVYSSKRYEGALESYTQYLFRKRLALFLGMVSGLVSPTAKLDIFEIGCADGVILQNLRRDFGARIGKMLGVDISAGMIDEARRKNSDGEISFLLRGEEGQEKYDLVIELGVHVEDLKREVEYVKSHLKAGGHFVYSVASRTSLHARLKQKGVAHVKDYLTYPETENILLESFTIVKKVPYGFFVPKLWSVPFVARLLQPVFDTLARPFAKPFHEQIYLLKRRVQ